MKITSTLASAGAICVGLTCVAVDTWSNVEFVAGGAVESPADLARLENWNSLTAAVVAVAAATAIALAAAGSSWRRGAWGIAAGLFAAFLCGAVFSLSATLERVGSARDAAVHGKASANLAIERTEAAIAAQRAIIEDQRATADAQCRGYVAGKSRDAEWPKCLGARARAERAEVELARLQADLAGFGARQVEDSMGTRIAAVLPWVTPSQVQTYQPMFLPVALFLFGNLLTAFGLAGIAPAPAAANVRATSSAGQIIDLTPAAAPAPAPAALALPAPAIDADPVLAVLAPGEVLSNRQLAARAGLSEAATSRRVLAHRRQGLLEVERNGRAVAIRRVR